jgi:hypothetical protein
MDEQKQPKLPERISLPTQTVNEILAIFSGMPYNQVANIIQKIQNEVQPVGDAGPITVTQDTPDQQEVPQS